MVSSEILLLSGVAIIFTTLVVLTVIGFFLGTKKSSENKRVDKLTVLIPFRNDYAAVEILQNRLEKRIPLDEKIRVVFIDDHSTDLPEDYIKQRDITGRFEFISARTGVTGKKAVVREAIKKVDTEWILLLDADTNPSAELFKLGNLRFWKNAKMVLIPLYPQTARGFIRAFFDLDFLSLHFTGLGSARIGIPVLANAAALLISQGAYLKSEKIRTDWNLPSGDDIFLMTSIQKLFGNRAICVLPSFKPLCGVSFPKDLKSLWHQRLRWVAKVNHVKSTPFQVYSWVVLLAQMAILGCGVLLFLNSPIRYLWLPIGAVFISELVLLALACIFARRLKLLVAIIPALFIYPFYLFALVVSGIFVRPIWK